MIEFGKTLREAREAKGYSVSQLAEITHILPQIVENFEKEDFTRIVAPIYGRGFVKLYCEAVGIEAAPLVAEFMEIYNGNRQPSIRLMEVEAEAPAPEPPPPAEPPLLEPPPPAEPPLLETPPPAEPPPLETPPPAEPPPLETLFPPEPPAPAAEAQPVSKAPEPFAPVPDDLPPSGKPKNKAWRDYRFSGSPVPDVPRSFWRFGMLFVAAVVVVVLLLLGTRALYRMTMEVPVTSGEAGESRSGEAEDASVTEKPGIRNQESEARSQKPAAPRAPRKGVEVPPLYID